MRIVADVDFLAAEDGLSRRSEIAEDGQNKDDNSADLHF